MDIKKIKKQKSIHELLEFGIINFDKPAGCTSFDVVDFVKKSLKLRKTSHFGTLDPMVTGVLPIALNRAVKLTGFFIGEDKEYEGTMRIHGEVSLEKIKKIIKEKFTGKIIQLPPVKSRVKRQEREREIKKFELLEKDGKNISFRVECQGGTYIRKLVHDLGEAIGTGAHMTKLRRVRAGIFIEKDSITKENFEKVIMNEENLRKIIIPAEEAIKKVFPVVNIRKDNLRQIFTGKPIHKKDLIKSINLDKEEICCVFSESRFIGMYEVIKDKDIILKSKFVMQPIK